MGNGGRLNFVLFVCFVTVYEVNSLTWTAMNGGVGFVTFSFVCFLFVVSHWVRSKMELIIHFSLKGTYSCAHPLFLQPLHTPPGIRSYMAIYIYVIASQGSFGRA